jgi:hypothetical protein
VVGGGHLVYFRIKLLALVAARVNAAVYHFGIERRIGEWDIQPRAPRAARPAGAVSIWSG